MPTAAPAAATNTAAQPAAPIEMPAAARLADALKIPVTLPVGHRGTPIANLSHSSLMRWTTCPDDWRRHYLLGERGPQTGAMFLVVTLLSEHRSFAPRRSHPTRL